ncbi:MAG: succinic semialdehyde dehydrogenase [Mobilicoccus sp.]|nr:succinic semialdehyde dehydrogenase [Mobilicoccus sp.]
MPRPTSTRVAELATRVAPVHGPAVTVAEAFTKTPLGQVPTGTADDVDIAFAAARSAGASWAVTPVKDRAGVLTRFADLVHERSAEILDVIQAESGKNRMSALDEVLDVMLNARFYASKAPRWLADERIPGPLPGLSSATVVHEPRGVVGMISPWNYPFSLPLSDGLAAVVAGNAVVHKPASLTPLSTLLGLELLAEAGLPELVWQVVPGSGREVGSAVVERCDFLMFTGSSATGAQLGAQVGARLVPFSAELGGKNPMIVGAGADLPRVVEIATRACFASGGQLCMSIERIYVEDAVYEDFCRIFAERVRAMKIRGGYGWGPEMGSLASADQLDVVLGHLRDAVDKGANVLAGGRHRPDLGPFFVEPTLLTDVPSDALCHREETFGPLVSIYRVADLNEAVARANDSEYGLTASVFAATPELGQRVARRLRTGMANVDEGYAIAWASLAGPSGGMGASGVGYRHGREGLLKYTHARTIGTQSRRLHLGGPGFLHSSAWGPALERSTHLMRHLRR